MSIVKMKHLRLMGLRQDREELLRLLQRMGCVEIDELDVDRTDPEWAGLTSPDGAALARAMERRGEGERALSALKRYAPEKDKSRLALTQDELFDPGQLERGEQAIRQVLDTERSIAALQAQQAKLEEEREALAPWLGLDVPLDTPSTREVTVLLGTLPASVELSKAEGRLLAVTDLAQLTCAGSDAEHHHILLMYHNSAQEDVSQTLKELGWARVVPRNWIGTALENDRRMAGEIKAIEGQLTQAQEQLRQLGGVRADLQRVVDRSAVDVRREEGANRLLDSGSAFYLEGWVPQDGWDATARALENYACAFELNDPKPEDYEKVPVKLKNNWFTKPLNMVTEMYVYPAYDGLDPNPFMAPFFIVFFGLMMADMAYGLLMLLGGWYLLKKLHAKGTMGHMGGLLVLCGVSTLVFGALTGGFLGDFIPQLAKLIDPESNVQLPYLFTPLTDTLAILVGSLVLGVIQIITGMAISVVYKCRNGEWVDALWNEITWWIVLAGAALAILGVSSVVLYVGLVMLVYGSTRNAKGFGKVTALIGAVYNGVSGYFSDILSYARLMALMLAGAVIAQVFNTLGSVTGNVIGFVIISLIGNALNLALNLLGCYVHDLRLQCLEFFGRFYKEGGRQFRPMAFETKYVDIKEEN
mgnify:CR=1 FL=1